MIDKPPARSRRPLLFLLAALLLLAAGSSVAAWVVRAVGALRYPYQLNYTEGSVANWAAWADAGLNVYPPIVDGPFIHHPYMPLFQGAIHLVGRLGIHDLRVLRVLGVLPTLLLAVLLFRIVRRSHGGWVAPSLAAGLWLSWPATYVFGVMVRPEMLGVVLATCGMARLRPTRLGVVEAVGWFGAAVMCKQPFVFAAAWAGAWLLVRQWRMGLLYGLAMALWGAGVLALACRLTDGWFWWHAVVATNNTWEWQGVQRWFAFHARHVSVPVALAAWAAVGEVRERSVTPWTVYCGGAWLATFLVGKVGADLHYFVEPAVPTIVLAASAVKPLLRPHSGLRIAAACALAVGTIAPLIHWPGAIPIYRYDWLPTGPARAERDAVVTWIREQPDGVLCLDQELVVYASKRCWVQPWIYAILAREGTWDQTPLLQQVRAGRFHAILLPHRVDLYDQIAAAQIFYTAEFNAGVAKHYILRGIIPRSDGTPWWYWYGPRH